MTAMFAQYSSFITKKNLVKESCSSLCSSFATCICVFSLGDRMFKNFVCIVTRFKNCCILLMHIAL